MKNRVLLLVATPLPVPAIQGGAIESLMTHLAEENEKNHKIELTIMTISQFEADSLRRKYKNTRFVTFPKYSKIICKTFWFPIAVLKKLLKIVGILIPFSSNLYDYKAVKYIIKHKNDYDLIIRECSAEIFGMLYKKLPKTTFVVHQHHIDHSFEWHPMINSAICVSQYVTDVLPPTDKPKYVLKNCCDLTCFLKRLSDKEKQTLMFEHNIPSDSFVILFVGRVIPEKGVLELITAVKTLSNRGYKLNMLLLGSSNFMLKTSTKYERIVQNELKKSDVRIIHTGYIANNEVYKYQAISHVQVIPSTCEEASSLTVFEAQAAGLPVVATRRGGLPEMLCPDAGILIEAGDQLTNNLVTTLEELIQNPDKLKYMRDAGVEWAKQFNPKKYYNDFVEIVEKICKKIK